MRRRSKQWMVVWWTSVWDREQNLCNPKRMKIELPGKDSLLWQKIFWCISLSRCHKRWRFRMRRLLWKRNGKSSRPFQHGIWEKWRAKKEVILEAQRDKKTESILLHWWTYSTTECRTRTKIAEVKDYGRSCKIARLWRTSSRRDICIHSGKIGGCSKIAQKFQSQNVQISGYVFHDTGGRNHGIRLRIPW